MLNFKEENLGNWSSWIHRGLSTLANGKTMYLMVVAKCTSLMDLSMLVILMLEFLMGKGDSSRTKVSTMKVRCSMGWQRVKENLIMVPKGIFLREPGSKTILKVWENSNGSEYLIMKAFSKMDKKKEKDITKDLASTHIEELSRTMLLKASVN
jgi:hypothetical protein